MKTANVNLFLCVLSCALVLFLPVVHAGEKWVGNSPDISDTKAEVLLKVGAPTWKLRWEKAIVKYRDTPRETTRHIVIEEWYYNYGPRRLVRAVRFANNSAVDIRTAGYGYSADELAGRRTSPDETLTIGESQFEVLRKWGPPWHQHSDFEQRYRPYGEDGAIRTDIYSDEWTYNFGPNRFIKVLEFQNGKLVDIRRGGYGK